VLDLVLPGRDAASTELLERGMTSPGGDDGYTNSPPRARILRWFSRRRNGFAKTADLALLRRGAVWRELVIVPLARVQSIELRQGPLLRALRLASVRLHTVSGPVDARLGALDATDATGFFAGTSDAAIRAASVDASHRWRSPVDSSTSKASSRISAVAGRASAG
jgi:putative membrane protein